MSRRTNCERRKECGKTGHLLVDGKYTRCPCLLEDLREQTLGAMYAPDLVPRTDLEGRRAADTVIEGPLAGIRRHVGRVLLDMRERGEDWITLDAYRLIEIFLGEDQIHESQFAAINPDLLVLLLGFADPPNRYLPELILQVLARRELIRKPTWVVLGIPQNHIGTKYNSVLQEKIDTFKKVRIK